MLSSVVCQQSVVVVLPKTVVVEQQKLAVHQSVLRFANNSPPLQASMGSQWRLKLAERMQCTQSRTVSCDRFLAFNKALNGYCILSWMFFQVHRQVIGDMHQVYLQVRVNTISAACYGTSAVCKSTRLSTCGTASNGRRDVQRRDVQRRGWQRRPVACRREQAVESPTRAARCRAALASHGVRHEHRTWHPLLVVNRQGFGPWLRHKNLRCTTCEILYNTITKLTPLTTALVIFIKHNQETALVIFIKHNLETALVIFIKHNQKTCQYRSFIKCSTESKMWWSEPQMKWAEARRQSQAGLEWAKAPWAETNLRWSERRHVVSHRRDWSGRRLRGLKRTSDEVSGGMSSDTCGTGVDEGSVGWNEPQMKWAVACHQTQAGLEWAKAPWAETNVRWSERWHVIRHRRDWSEWRLRGLKRTSDELSGGMSSGTGGTGMGEGSVGWNEPQMKWAEACHQTQAGLEWAKAPWAETKQWRNWSMHLSSLTRWLGDTRRGTCHTNHILSIIRLSTCTVYWQFLRCLYHTNLLRFSCGSCWNHLHVTSLETSGEVEPSPCNQPWNIWWGGTISM